MWSPITVLEAADMPRFHTLANENIKRGDVLDLAIIEQKPSERQNKKTCRAKKQKLHPAEAEWRKPPMTRVEHDTLPVRGERSRASQPLRHGGLFDISLFFPPYALPYRPRNLMERARVSGNFTKPRVELV